MAREYFLTYHDNLSALKLLSDSERGRLYLALLEYSAKDENPVYENLILNGNEKFLFEIMKTQIDREKEKYKKQCDVNKENGKYGSLGGRPKKTAKSSGKNPPRVLKTPKEEEEKDEEEYENKDKKENTPKGVQKKTAAKADVFPRLRFGEFENVLLSEEEKNKLTEKLGYKSDALIEDLSRYLASTGRKYKSHYAVLLTWARKEEEKAKPSSGGEKNELGSGDYANSYGKSKSEWPADEWNGWSWDK